MLASAPTLGAGIRIERGFANGAEPVLPETLEWPQDEPGSRSKAIAYAGFVIVLMTVLAELGVKLTAILGAAGIVGIAVAALAIAVAFAAGEDDESAPPPPMAAGSVAEVGTAVGVAAESDPEDGGEIGPASAE